MNAFPAIGAWQWIDPSSLLNGFENLEHIVLAVLDPFRAYGPSTRRARRRTELNKAQRLQGFTYRRREFRCETTTRRERRDAINPEWVSPELFLLSYNLITFVGLSHWHDLHPSSLHDLTKR